MEATPVKQRKIHRWIFLAALVLGFIAQMFYPPIRPHVQVPAENLTHLFGNFYLTNTLIATLLADIILISLALSVRRASRKGKLVFTGMAGAVAGILEMLYGLTESTAGKWARKIFPYFATIFLLVLVVNWMELIPGVDSIGILHHDDHGSPTQQILPGVVTIVKAAEGEHHEGGYGLIPFVRVASTDLNFTIALALSSVVMTQVIGFRALGGGYFSKYINLRGLRKVWKKPRFKGAGDFLFSLIDFLVGILEIIAEVAKIISFSFRLFGNIFAGSVLLFVIGSLVPVFAQSIFLLLELFVGMIQAFVFGMLTMVFMAQATEGHGGHDEEHAH